MLFLSTAWADETPEYRSAKKELGKSFRGFVDGVGNFGKGFWQTTTNGGKVLWYGTREGMVQGARGAKKVDNWMQKNLW